MSSHWAVGSRLSVLLKSASILNASLWFNTISKSLLVKPLPSITTDEIFFIVSPLPNNRKPHQNTSRKPTSLLPKRRELPPVLPHARSCTLTSTYRRLGQVSSHRLSAPNPYFTACSVQVKLGPLILLCSWRDAELCRGRSLVARCRKKRWLFLVLVYFTRFCSSHRIGTSTCEKHQGCLPPFDFWWHPVDSFLSSFSDTPIGKFLVGLSGTPEVSFPVLTSQHPNEGGGLFASPFHAFLTTCRDYFGFPVSGFQLPRLSPPTPVKHWSQPWFSAHWYPGEVFPAGPVTVGRLWPMETQPSGGSGGL